MKRTRIDDHTIDNIVKLRTIVITALNEYIKINGKNNTREIQEYIQFLKRCCGVSFRLKEFPDIVKYRNITNTNLEKIEKLDVNLHKFLWKIPNFSTIYSSINATFDEYHPSKRQKLTELKHHNNISNSKSSPILINTVNIHDQQMCKQLIVNYPCTQQQQIDEQCAIIPVTTKLSAMIGNNDVPKPNSK